MQYASGDYRKRLAADEAKASMSGKGNCLDNAPMGHASRSPLRAVFGSLKTEMVHRSHFRPCREAKAALLEYIAIFYNRQHRHSHSGYRTPVQARTDMTRAAAE